MCVCECESVCEGECVCECESVCEGECVRECESVTCALLKNENTAVRTTPLWFLLLILYFLLLRLGLSLSPLLVYCIIISCTPARVHLKVTRSLLTRHLVVLCLFCAV